MDYEAGSMHNWALGYGGTLANPLEDISRRVNEILDLSISFKINSILDFGSGSGEMISALSEHFEVEGLEPEEQALLSCNKQNMRVHASTEELRNKEKRFDLVTLFHVVEHFYKPDAELVRIYELLKPSGLLLIETPNSQDALLTKYQSNPFANFTYWTHHPMLHSNKLLASLVTRNQFKLITNSGTQRYGSENHFFWLTNSKLGGHIEWVGMFSENTNLNYGENLVSQGLADTIWLLAQKI